jgi:hypothetical protein
LHGENVELASLTSISFNANASPKYYLDSVLNTLHCPKLRTMNISSMVHEWDTMYFEDLQHTLALAHPAYPELSSMELNYIDCNEFFTNFDFTELPELRSISLVGCTSPVAVLRLLLPSILQDRTNGNCVWPLLQNVLIRTLDAEDFDGLCEVISYRIAIGRPISCVTMGSCSYGKFPDKVRWMKEHVQLEVQLAWIN